jgi:hypothetical protein
MKYLPKPKLFGNDSRVERVQNPDWAIRYIGAIMDAYADAADAEKSKAGLRNRPEILATLYNGIEVDRTKIPVDLPNPRLPGFNSHVPILPVNARSFFKYKILMGDTYQPGPSMGTWVQTHRGYLRSALGLKP